MPVVERLIIAFLSVTEPHINIYNYIYIMLKFFNCPTVNKEEDKISYKTTGLLVKDKSRIFYGST